MLELETVSPGFGNKTRRAFLQAGFLGIGSLTLADLLKLQAKAAVKPIQSDTAVILLWCGGGPSQLETYDMKPDAPSEIRGPMNAIKSNVLGINVCELLPHHAQVAEKFTIIEQRLSVVRFAGLLGRDVSRAGGVARAGELAIAGEAGSA